LWLPPLFYRIATLAQKILRQKRGFYCAKTYDFCAAGTVFFVVVFIKFLITNILQITDILMSLFINQQS